MVGYSPLTSFGETSARDAPSPLMSPVTFGVRLVEIPSPPRIDTSPRLARWKRRPPSGQESASHQPGLGDGSTKTGSPSIVSQKTLKGSWKPLPGRMPKDLGPCTRKRMPESDLCNLRIEFSKMDARMSAPTGTVFDAANLVEIREPKPAFAAPFPLSGERLRNETRCPSSPHRPSRGGNLPSSAGASDLWP